MQKKSVSTLIYYQEKIRKRSQVKPHVHVNKEKRARAAFSMLKLFSFLLVSTCAVFLYVKYRPLRVANVEVYGAGRFVSLDDVQKIAQTKVLGRDIVVISTVDVEQAVAQNYLAAKSVRVIKSYPKTIKVTITERVPIALLLSKETAGYYFVDAEGFVLGSADETNTNLPVILYGQRVYIGKFLGENAVAYYFELIQALDESSILVSTISSFPKYIQFYTRDNVEALFTIAQSPKSQAKILARMLEAFKAEGKKTKKIDLRFDKVIVEFTQEATESK